MEKMKSLNKMKKKISQFLPPLQEWASLRDCREKVAMATMDMEGEGKKYCKDKPKFKVGDFILNGDVTDDGKKEIFKIRNVCSDWYDVENIYDGRRSILTFKQEWSCRLWDITDANDGDVLVDKFSKDTVLVLFKRIVNGFVLAHCGWNNYELSVREEGFGYGNVDNTKYVPAAKEQRDFLFSKMKEVGYKWDDEKKGIVAIKLTPKFKVGDWIVDSQGLTHQIERVLENVTTHAFGYDIVGGGFFNDNNEGVHLWTIQDAKDGDVLANDGLICIFKGLDEVNNVKTPCVYTINDRFTVLNCDHEENLIGSFGLKPATTKQRNALFEEMRKSGYRWDADKKELEKIVIDEGKDEMDYCFTKMMLGEPSNIQNSEWSEEDDRIVRDITNELSYIKGTAMVEQYKHVLDGEIDWLKGIKKRILKEG